MKFIDDFLYVAPTPIKLAEELAGWFYSQIHQPSEQNKPYCIAISGGNTPILFFNQLAAKFGHHIDWSNIHFFWADERCVSPTSNESNFRMAQINLLSKIVIPEKNIHRIRGENDPTKETLRYADEIASFVPIVDDIPKFDIIMLGMGDDGHTASLFPGQEKLIFSGNLVEESVNPHNNQHRITLTPYCINNASKVLFQITGLTKSNMVNSILLHSNDNKMYPAAHIKPVNGDLYWFLDSGASKGTIN